MSIQAFIDQSIFVIIINIDMSNIKIHLYTNFCILTHFISLFFLLPFFPGFHKTFPQQLNDNKRQQPRSSPEINNNNNNNNQEQQQPHQYQQQVQVQKQPLRLRKKKGGKLSS